MRTLGTKLWLLVLRVITPALFLWIAFWAVPAPAASKNFLLVIADDYGIDSQSLYNTNPAASLPPTPNINALAARGVRFANAYGYPTCSPTRSAILTGRYGFRTGVAEVLDAAGAQGIYTNELTLPEALSATHRCGSFGKWHLGGNAPAPNSIGGWGHFAGSLGGALGMAATNFYLWTKTTNGVSRPNHFGYATSDNVNDALAWLGAQDTNRWFLWLAFNAPHTPYHLPPTNLCPHYAGLSGTAADIQQNPRKYYEASVEAMDTELGRLLATIDTNATTVLFIGDNGTPPRVIQPPYNIAGRAKDTLYEGGVRVPFIAAGPDIIGPARTNDAIVHVVDLFATILELAGVDMHLALPHGLPSDSRSLVSILHNQAFAPAEPAVLLEDPDPLPPGTLTGRAVRLGQFKLIAWDSALEELYDLDADPLEGTNLLVRTLSAAQQSSLDQLRSKLAAWNNTPAIDNAGFLGNAFAVEAGWFVNPNFSLWRNADAATTNWTRVSNATTLDLGTTIRLSDPQPPAGKSFYRVLIQ